MKAFVLSLAILACAAGTAMAQPNTLTAPEKSAGWKLLFDGKTTAGWRGFKAPAPDSGWTVRDGALSPDPKTSKDIMTKDSFENFELAFDWKISPKGNSGVMFHVIEEGDQTYQSGPEYQVLDNSRGEPPLEQAGAAYALYPPAMDMTKPVGEFNQARIVVDHGKVQHWLNGMMVVEYDLNSAEFKAKVAGSKFKAWPQFASSPTGHIALQNHGDDVAYRNIRIRLLK
jgi:3-keto-disaccharide hydrolase